MEPIPRHQCFLYEGPCSASVPCLGEKLQEMLRRNYRCLYLNCEPMLDEMREYLIGAGLDLDAAVREGRLILTADRDHIMNGRFCLESMMQGLSDALAQALADGFEGLFATGDMSWEFGPEADFSELMEYEWRLENFFEEHPQLSGICQYHLNSLPYAAMQQGLATHPALFVHEELSVVNPHYVEPRTGLQLESQGT